MTRLKVPIIPGDTVYFMYGNKIVETTVISVTCNIELNTYQALTTSFTYQIDKADVPSHITAYWDIVYLTKQEVLDTLL